MRKAVFLVLLFFISVMAPLASSATTETQFKGGATSYTKTFSGQGNGSAGVITFPLVQKSPRPNSISWVKQAPRLGAISPPTTILVVSAVANGQASKQVVSNTVLEAI